MLRTALLFCLFTIPPLLLFYSVKSDFYRDYFTYMVIGAWSIAAVLLTNRRKMMKNRVLVLSHLIVAIIGVVGIADNYLYSYFNVKENMIFINLTSSSMIFMAEDLLYLCGYGIIILFTIDMVRWLKPKPTKT